MAAEEKEQEVRYIPAAVLEITNALESHFGAAVANTMRDPPSRNHRRRARRAAKKEEEAAVVRFKEDTDVKHQFQGCGYAL